MAIAFISLSLILTSISLLVQGLENLVIVKGIGKNSPWSWDHIKSEFKGLPYFMENFFTWIFAEKFFLVISVQMVTAILLPFKIHWIIEMVLFLSLWMTGLRFRGVLCGGSDYMTVTCLFGLCLSLWGQRLGNLVLLYGGIYFISVQCTLSYFIAGWIKAKSQNWRRGIALKCFLLHSNYRVPNLVKKSANNNCACKILSWLVIFWELTFPVIWIQPHLSIIYLSIGICFHLANFYIFGLNRFFFAWIATYPVLFFCVTQRGK